MMILKPKALVVPEPDEALLAKTLLHFLGINEGAMIACEHGCKHTAKDFVEAHLLQFKRQAQISICNTIGVEVQNLE